MCRCRKKSNPGILWCVTCMREPFEEERPKKPEERMSKKEARVMAFSALLAGLTVGAIFIGGALVFLLFCVFIWFK